MAEPRRYVPIGSFQGTLSALSASDLGAIHEAVERAGAKPEHVGRVNRGAALPASTEAQCSDSHVGSEEGGGGTGSKDEGEGDDDPDPPTLRKGSAAVPLAPILVLHCQAEGHPVSRLSAFTFTASAALIAQLACQYYLTVAHSLKDLLENLWVRLVL